MNLIIKDNLKGKDNYSDIKLSINDQVVWVNIPKNNRHEFKLSIKSSSPYELKLYSDKKVYKSITIDSLDNKYIYISTSKASKYMGLRGILASKVAKAIGKEFNFKVKNN